MAKKNKKTNKDIMAYFGSYLDAVQSTSIQGLNDPGATRDLVGKPLNVGLAPTADMSIDTTKAVGPDNKITDIDAKAAALPNKALTDMKAKGEKKPGFDMGNFEGINIKSAVGSIFPLINALTGEKDPARQAPFEPLQVYNPHPLGTGSQMLFENGGKMKKKGKKAQWGTDVNGDPEPQMVNNNRKAGTWAGKDRLDNNLTKEIGNQLTGSGYTNGTMFNTASYLGEQNARDLITDLSIYQQRNDVQKLSQDEMINSYFNQPSTNPNIDGIKKNLRSMGYGPVANHQIGKLTGKNATLASKKNGGEIKAFWGAIAGAAQQVGGKITDQMKEQTKLAAQAPQEIASFFANMANFKDGFNQGGGYVPGPYMQQDQMRYMEDGGEIEGMNQIMLHDQGSLTELSGNPYDGGTVQLNGPSHANDGIDMSYGNTRVEAEGGETAVKDAEGNLHIMGNMKVPGSKTKFKTLSKKIAEKEKDYEKMKTDGIALVNALNPTNKFDRLGFNSGTLMMKGGDLGQKDLAEKKNNLTALQNALLNTAEEFNLSPDALAEGEVKKAKRGTFKAASGATLDPGPKKSSVAQRHNNPGNIKFGEFAKSLGATKGEAATDGGNFAIFPDVETGLNAIRRLLQTKTYRNKPVEEAIKTWTGGSGYAKGSGQLAGKTIKSLSDGELDQLVDHITYGEDGKYFKGRTPGTPSRQSLIPKAPNVAPPTNPASPYIPIDPYGLPDLPLTYKQGKPAIPINPAAPGSPDVNIPEDRNIPSNTKGLSMRQILPELAAIGGNRTDPVYARQFTPLLEQPYQVSFQDRINENQATFNAVARQLSSNPLALSTLSAQQYQADSSVLADEFRFNQGEANRVYNANRQTTNQAEMTNLGIRDQQYVRQAQAKSNTEAQTNEILKSISSKYSENSLNNKRLAIYENMYNFRAKDTNKDGSPDKLINYNPDAMFNYGTSSETGNDPFQRTTTIVNEANQLKQKKMVNPSLKEQQLIDLRIQKEKAKTPIISIGKLFNR